MGHKTFSQPPVAPMHPKGLHQQKASAEGGALTGARHQPCHHFHCRQASKSVAVCSVWLELHFAAPEISIHLIMPSMLHPCSEHHHPFQGGLKDEHLSPAATPAALFRIAHCIDGMVSGSLIEFRCRGWHREQSFQRLLGSHVRTPFLGR